MHTVYRQKFTFAPKTTYIVLLTINWHINSIALLYPSNSLHLHPKPPLQHLKTIDRSMHIVYRKKFTFAPKTTYFAV